MDSPFIPRPPLSVASLDMDDPDAFARYPKVAKAHDALIQAQATLKEAKSFTLTLSVEADAAHKEYKRCKKSDKETATDMEGFEINTSRCFDGTPTSDNNEARYNQLKEIVDGSRDRLKKLRALRQAADDAHDDAMDAEADAAAAVRRATTALADAQREARENASLAKEERQYARRVKEREAREAARVEAMKAGLTPVARFLIAQFEERTSPTVVIEGAIFRNKFRVWAEANNDSEGADFSDKTLTQQFKAYGFNTARQSARTYGIAWPSIAAHIHEAHPGAKLAMPMAARAAMPVAAPMAAPVAAPVPVAVPVAAPAVSTVDAWLNTNYERTGNPADRVAASEFYQSYLDDTGDNGMGKDAFGIEAVMRFERKRLTAGNFYLGLRRIV